MNSKKTILIFILLIFLLVLLFLADLLTGPVHIPLKEFFHMLSGKDAVSDINRTILVAFRLPKAITALMAGAALSVSGLQMQTIFRNPLAGPYVLGISSGAGLGVALVVLGFGSVFSGHEISYLGNWVQIMAAWTGSALVLFIILLVSVKVKDIMTILILGILFGSAASAIISILQYFSQQTMLKAFVIWSMGNLGSLSVRQLYVLIPCILAGLLMSMIQVKQLNLFLLGETYAKSMGMNIRISRILVFISTSILAGSITAFCGPIGFIGIAVPHVVRLILNTANHRILIPGTILTGAIVLLGSDIISTIPGRDVILPVNSVTALMGIPVVIWLIVKNRRLSSLN
ncbi:MAG: iron ABC transporter permease [Bacteroidales bacterium]|nr:iron ABC transporter permease [Bacteroidales bacterium]